MSNIIILSLTLSQKINKIKINFTETNQSIEKNL